ncbi:hypothetical protein [Blastococcus xanthinilyticus]|uniref:Uncharacterized protein n=1 Tax=Blastococcus xanthinilyticus TaxID=1564164 RepID=A0A5S5CXU3_9ACTN|nr:hypothetical protein [Blastococcus xanthinilyticus]TYP87914.1 hypothetical protein BD833_10588 [Blastococcus xanthinilyticus]
MPASSSPTPADGSAAPETPPSVRVALALLATLAVLLLIYVVVTVLGWDGLVTALVEVGLTAEEARQYLIVNTTAPLAMGLLYGVSAWALSTHRSWGRWSGLAGTAALALLVLATMLTAGGVTLISLLLLVLSVAAAASLAARTTRDWLAAPRA